MARGFTTTARALTGAALLLAGAAIPPAAHATVPAAQDLGATPGATTVTARIRLPMADQAGFDAALRARYTYGNPLFHHWMSDTQVASFGPKAADVAAVRRALAEYGLTVTAASRSNNTLTVTGSAAAVQRAFGTQLHTMLRGGTRSFVHTTALKPQGALAGRVSGVGGLVSSSMHPMIAHQVGADGQPIPGVPVPAAGSAAASPLAAFTDQCFTRNASATLSGGGTTATYTGVGYALNGLTCGYTPQQIASHYGIDQAYDYGIDGRGQTIVIVDAYGSPTAKADANTFFAAVGIAPFTDDNFQIITPAGAPAKVDYGWAGETALDIELAHAIAPGAKIVLAEAPTNNDSDLQATVQYVIDNGVGNVVSNSYGESENDSDAATIAGWDLLSKEAAAKGITLDFSTGDDGDYQAAEGKIGVSSPSDSSFATAVGGTSIDVPSGNGVAEVGWGNYRATLGSTGAPTSPTPQGFYAGGGGGDSAFIARPYWQQGLPGTNRVQPDLGLIADPYTGAIIVEPQQNAPSVFTSIGGTSLSSPVFSAMWALVNETSGFNPGNGQITPGSSFGVPGPQLNTFSNYVLKDAVPLSPPQQLSGTIATATSTTTFDGFGALGIPENPGALTVLRLRAPASAGNYSALSFNTDSSLATTGGYDYATGRGVPNGAGAVAIALLLLGINH